ncbi:hypothetical protein VMCG_09359 [Cytospora schulzeri]|uniref:C3H1-type domain-containing protein n=1 Tax=Cytospora schulzeri TaxID=448051 RepID=A0A423VJU6_9PEZI|nr:hypothetical protein VMCG_09359 [Valsa malicola]
MAMTMTSTNQPDAYLAKLQAIQLADEARFEEFQKAELERRGLLSDIMSKYTELLEDHKNLQIDYRTLQKTNRSLYKESELKDRELSDLKLERDSNPMVGVFIDGDGAKFHEELIKDGVEGGEKAAHALQMGIKKHLKEMYPDTNTDGWQIMVWCIAAMDGLVGVYEMNLSQKDGYSGVNFTSAFRRFVIGFNRGAHYTFNFIDVGGGRGLKLKEITDAKLRDTFRMMLPHCKHVFFAGCHDEGYVSFLSPYKLDQNIAPRITLIETHNTMPKYHDLGFKMTSFPKVFRKKDFPPHGSMPLITQPPQQARPSNAIATTSAVSPPAAADSRSSTPVSSGSGTGPASSSWAAVGKGGLPPNKTIDIGPVKRTPGSSGKKYYLVNKEGERIDESLRTPAPELFERYNARIKNENRGLKFCNTCNFVGTDKCTQTGDFRHGPVNLPPAEFEVYRFLVRTTRCPSDVWCQKIDCPYSHHCKYGSSCDKDWECKFNDTHHMSRVGTVESF